MSALFLPLPIRSVTAKNRIVVSPMCQYSSSDGFANNWHLVHLGSFAAGGAGIVFTEATAVSPEGRITHHDLGIYKEAHQEFLERIALFISSQNSIPAIQLAHAGRKASHHRPWDGGAALSDSEDPWKTLAPSAIPYRDNEPLPKEMSIDEIKKVVNDFRSAALRSKKCGFKIIELHAAHGYLLHEFLSPISNQRQDEYGGRFENRIRLLIDTVNAVREVWDENLPFFVRISATDWVEGGWNIEETIALAHMLKKISVDLTDCSSGGNSPAQKIPVGPMYQVPFAEAIRKQASIMTGAVGLITSPVQAEEIIAKKKADLVFLAREHLRDPHFTFRAANALGVDINYPPQYDRAKKHWT